MKKGIFSTVILILVLVVGLSLLLYPTIANWWNEMHTTRAIADYESIMANISDEDYSHLFDDAMAYNEALRQLDYPLMYHDEVPGYFDLLEVTGSGVMGYINIPKIDVQLPIYHGTSEEVLQIAVGHVQGSSLPTGGESTHCVLSAHRGLPSAKLFTDLNLLEVGDTFTVTVIDRLLTYRVDQVLIVEPTEVEPLYVEEGQDYCTLITCTPYAVNTHRMLVRGVRIENEKQFADIRVTADASIIEPVLVAPFVAAPILLVLFVLLMLPKQKHRQEE